MTEPANEHLDAPIPGPDWEAQRREIRQRVLSVFGPFPEKKVPLDVETVDIARGAGRYSHTREKIRIRADDGDDWITAYVLVPVGLTKPAPALICPHPTTEGAGKDVVVGISGSKPGTPPEPKYSYGLEPAAEWGFVTVAFDNFHDGERVRGRQRLNDTTDFYERYPNWSAAGKFVWDTRRIVDYLQKRPDVNGGAIGIIGHSLGAHVAVFSAALDERIRACVSNGGTHCWDEGERFHWAMSEGADGRRWEYLRKARAFLEKRPVRAPFSFVELTALIAPRPLRVLLTENGARRQRLADFVMQLRRPYGALGADDALESGMYSGGHRFPPEERHRAYRWLKTWLK